jgi:hypothetical protein
MPVSKLTGKLINMTLITRTITSIIAFIIFLSFATVVDASLYYGEPPVKGVTDDPFVPRKPGLGDNPVLLGFVLTTAAAVFFIWSRKLKSVSLKND